MSAVRWSTHFYSERSGRGHVRAGVRGTPIETTVEMREEVKAESRRTESFERTCEPDSIWAKEMERAAVIAEQRVRHEWDVWRRS